MTTSYSCVACGDAGAPCCADDGKTQQCKDGQACQANYCPAAIPAGWAGDPCGTGDDKCQGKLTCSADQKCECSADSQWTVCSADNSKVCAPGDGPPGGDCTNWPADASFKPTNSDDTLCTLFKGNCDNTTKGNCAAGQFHMIMINGKSNDACYDSTSDGSVLRNAIKGSSTDPSQTNFCYVTKS